jgi:hypothetical protein
VSGFAELRWSNGRGERSFGVADRSGRAVSQTVPVDRSWAQSLADKWVRAWNAHDVEAVLSHFAEDVIFTSPVAARVVPDSGGVVRGKEALRAYWSLALSKVPDLHFEVVSVFVGVSTLVIAYRNQGGDLVSEVLEVKDGLVIRGHGTYLAGGEPAAVRSS